MADRESTKTFRLTRKTNRKRTESTRDFPAVVFEHHFPFSKLFNSKSLFVVSKRKDLFATIEKSKTTQTDPRYLKFFFSVGETPLHLDELQIGRVEWESHLKQTEMIHRLDTLRLNDAIL